MMMGMSVSRKKPPNVVPRDTSSGLMVNASSDASFAASFDDFTSSSSFVLTVPMAAFFAFAAAATVAADG